MRQAKVERSTKETSISICLDLDGQGKYQNSTGIGFFDHMLDGFSRQTPYDLEINAKGDLYVDQHHTVEDTGICFGTALKQSVGDARGINRYGYFILPMDDALVLCSLDLSGRSFLSFDVSMPTQKVGDFDTELVQEFFLGLTRSAGMTLHIKLLAGTNTHHSIECVFKAFGRALAMATGMSMIRPGDIPSTKGVL